MKNVVKIQLALCPGLQTNTETAGRLSFKSRRPVSISRETLVIFCKRLYKRTSAGKCFHHPKRPRNLLRTTPPFSLKNARERSYKRTRAIMCFHHPENPRILLQTTHPFSRKTLVNSRKHAYKRICAIKATAIPKIQESSKSCFRQLP